MSQRTTHSAMSRDERPVGACPSCLATHSRDLFFRNLSTPADCGYLPNSFEEAQACKLGPIELSLCRRCGLIRNERFDQSLIQFSPGYEVSLEHSPKFRNYITQTAQHLIQKFELRDKVILEIGCGDGNFLEQICRSGHNRGIGIDPALPKERDERSNPAIRFIRDCFSSRNRAINCDFICSMSVLEDIERVNELLRVVRDISAQNSAPVHFEVFNGWRTFDCDEVWNVHFEQCNYFSELSLANSIRCAGLDVKENSTCYGQDQYLYIQAIAGAIDQSPVKPSQEYVEKVLAFGAKFDAQQQLWSRRLSLIESGVVLWGAGGKGISFLNSIENSQAIDAVVDINPRRQSRFIPGTGHVIIGPQQLQSVQPRLVVISNELYRKEISEHLSRLGISVDIEVL